MYSDCVATLFGYRAEYTYHYLLNDDHWLMIKAYGSDVSRLIKYFETGMLDLEGLVEEPSRVSEPTSVTILM
jgi:hypothetical protein